MRWRVARSGAWLARVIGPLVSIAWLIVGCTPPGGDGGVPDGGDTFADHTSPRLDHEEDFFALSAEGAGVHAVKFIITGFGAPARALRWYDSAFYQLHDEWYWFRLMNGARAPGDTTEPFDGEFETIADIVAWAGAQEELPLDLRFVGERLYSPRFYQLALQTSPKVYGVGTLLYIDAREQPEPRDEIWAFELEYQDDVTHAELVVFFHELERTLPASIADRLRWLVRSPAQEELAVSMEEGDLAYHDRVLRYGELVVPGEVQVYSEGLTAGRLKVVRTGEPGLEESRSTDVLVVEEIPDYLPPCAGLLTSLPQTPLAHINVLAKNRGIPNAYVGGVLADPNLDQLARVRAPVVLLGEAPDRVVLKAISEQDFAAWRNLTTPLPIAVPPVDMGSLPYLLDLQAASLDDVEDLRPVIGGKAAGYLALLAPGHLVVPHAPLAITVRAYHEHIAPLLPRLEAMLAADDFRRSPRTRFLVLEGTDAFRQRFATEEDQRFLQQFLDERPAGDVLGDLVRDGGVRGILRDTPVNADTLALLRAELLARYGSYADSQGLRFRSSSSVEDIEGFNGAGLYTSNTGFLFPERQASPRDQQRSVEAAIKETWSSYWGAEAFEERELSRVDHLSGNMAVLVHARFDDELEVSNAVFTYTVLPEGFADVGVLEVNVQRGDLSVTNPPPGSSALPEVDVVRLGVLDEAPRIERVQRSTEVAAGEVVLSDAKLQRLFADARAVGEAWLAQENEGLLGAQRRRTLVLDFEMREMAEGWPALNNGGRYGQRVVIKQARSLEPGLLRVPADVRAQPFPRDVLARASLVERRDCDADVFQVVFSEAYTDPLKAPDLGHDLDPFTAFATFETKAPIAALGFEAGRRFSLVHSSFVAAAHPGMESGGAWNLEVEIDPARPDAQLLTAFALRTDGTYTLARGDLVHEGTWSGCETQVTYSTPEAFLRHLLEAGQ